MYFIKKLIVNLSVTRCGISIISFLLCLSITPNSHAQNQITNQHINKYYKPLPPPARKQEIERAQQRIDNMNQYEGDHGYLWYRKHQNRRSWYIRFNLNHSFFEDVTDLKVKRLAYTDTSTELGESELPSTTGIIERKGNLGMEFSLGYKRQGRFGYEAEIAHYKSVITKVSLPIKEPEATGFGTIDEVEFSITPIAANLLFHLGNSRHFVPYIRAGLGYAAVGTTKDYDLYPLEQYKAGINYNLNEKMSVYIAYKRIILGTIRYSFSVKSDTVSNAEYAKAKYIVEHDQDLDILSIGYKFSF